MPRPRKDTDIEFVLQKVPKPVRDFERAVSPDYTMKMKDVLRRAIQVLEEKPTLLPYNEFILYGGEGVNFLLFSAIAPILGIFDRDAHKEFLDAKVSKASIETGRSMQIEFPDEESPEVRTGLQRKGKIGSVFRWKEVTTEFRKLKVLEKVKKYLKSRGVIELSDIAMTSRISKTVSLSEHGFNLKAYLVFNDGRIIVRFEGLGYYWTFEISLHDYDLYSTKCEYVVVNPIAKWNGGSAFLDVFGGEYRELLTRVKGNISPLRSMNSMVGYPFQYNGNVLQKYSLPFFLSSGVAFWFNDLFLARFKPLPENKGVELQKKDIKAALAVTHLSVPMVEAAIEIAEELSKKAPKTVEAVYFAEIMGHEVSEEVSLPEKTDYDHIIIKAMEDVAKTDEQLMGKENELKEMVRENLGDVDVRNLHDYAWSVVSIKDDDGKWWVLEGRLYGLIVNHGDRKEVFPIGMEIHDVYPPDIYSEDDLEYKEKLKDVIDRLADYLADPGNQKFKDIVRINFSASEG